MKKTAKETRLPDGFVAMLRIAVIVASILFLMDRVSPSVSPSTVSLHRILPYIAITCDLGDQTMKDTGYLIKDDGLTFTLYGGEEYFKFLCNYKFTGKFQAHDLYVDESERDNYPQVRL